jgi:uncharacterized membrane protein
MILNMIILAVVLISSFLVLPYLPAQISMHWNVLGQVDQFVPKTNGIWFLPLLTILMFISFRVIPFFDPKKDKYALFKREWEIMQTGFILFFAYMQFIIVYLSLNPSVRMMPLMFIGLGSLFILIGNYLSKIRQNHFIGIRVPWTLASEDNWNKTHRFASWCYVIAGLLTLIESYFIWYAPVIIFGSILLASSLPMVYSFLLFKKAPQAMKYVYIGLFSVILLIGVLRVISGEDDWMCQNGQWVKHGQPSAPKPEKPCLK